MLLVGKRRTESSPVPGKKRSLRFWAARIFSVVAVTGLILFGLLWWRDRPLSLAETSLKNGDIKYAHYLVANHLKQNPHHERAKALQARIFVAAGYPDSAIALFEEAGADTVEDLRAWAHAYLMTEQFSLAIPLLEQVLTSEPNNPDTLYELTAARTRLGMFEEALESARKFAAIPGHEARGHMFMGAILRDLGKDEEAAKAYETVLKHDPKAENLQSPPYEFYLQYGQTLMRLGKPQEAIEPLKHSAADRETPEVLLELGNTALQLQRVDDARAAWKRALDHDPRYVQAREALARAELQQGQAEKALEWLAPITEQEVTLETAYLRQRAYTLAGKKEDALKWQEIATTLRKKQELTADIDNLLHDSPQSFWARVVRAHRFAERGNWKQAELITERLIQEAPGEPFVIELASAVHRRRDLPSLETMPIIHH